MDVQEDAGLSPDYRLKLNSYDLGVDIELADAIQRIRFEHPEVHAVVITSLKERIFCAGANIFMLRGSSHAWKVNFCKFTNETRLAIEDASAHSGPQVPRRAQRHLRRRRLRAGARLRRDPARRRRQLGGQPAGDAAARRAAGHRRPHARRRQAEGPARPRRRLRDGRRRASRAGARSSGGSSTRCIRRASSRTGSRSARRSWRPPPIGRRAARASRSVRSRPTVTDDAVEYSSVSLQIDRAGRVATLTVKAPDAPQPATPEEILKAGDAVLAAPRVPRARRGAAAAAHRRAAHRHGRRQHRGRCRGASSPSTRRCSRTRTTGSCARSCTS